MWRSRVSLVLWCCRECYVCSSSGDGWGWKYYSLSTDGKVRNIVDYVTMSYPSFAIYYLSHLMRLWYFSSSVNPIFKRACAAIQWGWMSDFWLDPSSTSIRHMTCANSKGSGVTTQMNRLAWASTGRQCDNLMSWLICVWIWLKGSLAYLPGKSDVQHNTLNTIWTHYDLMNYTGQNSIIHWHRVYMNLSRNSVESHNDMLTLYVLVHKGVTTMSIFISVWYWQMHCNFIFNSSQTVLLVLGLNIPLSMFWKCYLGLRPWKRHMAYNLDTQRGCS